jgi:hypothetical protein
VQYYKKANYQTTQSVLTSQREAVDLMCAATFMEYIRSGQESSAVSAHTATIDKAEYAFAATGIFRYRQNILSDEDFELSEVAHKDKIPDESLEGTEAGHSDVGFRLRGDGPVLPTIASL